MRRTSVSVASGGHPDDDESIDLLARFPRMGATIPKRSQVRKLLHSPILVYYRVHQDTHIVEVLHSRHGARKPSGI
jgi:plasmid stabilization system protein ParE